MSETILRPFKPGVSLGLPRRFYPGNSLRRCTYIGMRLFASGAVISCYLEILSREDSVKRSLPWSPSIGLYLGPDASGSFAAEFGTARKRRPCCSARLSRLLADEKAAIGKFNSEDGGFRDRDLYVFCFNASDGVTTAHANRRHHRQGCPNLQGSRRKGIRRRDVQPGAGRQDLIGLLQLSATGHRQSRAEGIPLSRASPARSAV